MPRSATTRPEAPATALVLPSFIASASDALRTIQFIHEYEIPADLWAQPTATTTTVDAPLGTDAVCSRIPLLANRDVILGISRASQSMDYFYRNAQSYETWWVHEGSGTLKSQFGNLKFRKGDYIVIPFGTTWQMHLDGDEAWTRERHARWMVALAESMWNLPGSAGHDRRPGTDHVQHGPAGRHRSGAGGQAELGAVPRARPRGGGAASSAPERLTAREGRRVTIIARLTIGTEGGSRAPRGRSRLLALHQAHGPYCQTK